MMTVHNSITVYDNKIVTYKDSVGFQLQAEMSKVNDLQMYCITMPIAGPFSGDNPLLHQLQNLLLS